MVAVIAHENAPRDSPPTAAGGAYCSSQGNPAPTPELDCFPTLYLGPSPFAAKVIDQSTA